MVNRTRPRAPRSARTARLVAGVALAALLVFVATRAAGYSSQVDFHPADELYCYLAGGRDMHRAGLLPNFAFSPLSCLAYCALDALPPLPWPPQDVVYWLGVLAAPAAAWWALRPLAAAPLPLLVAAWLGSSVRLLQADCIGTIATTHVYTPTLAIVFLALGACARRRFGWALVLLALAAVNRNELWPWFAVFGLALAASRATGWTTRRRWLVATAVAGATAAASLMPGVADKAWTTFRQHYAAAAVREDLRGRVEPGPAGRAALQLAVDRAFTEPDARVARDFASATSVPGALAANPAAFVAHVARNVRALPASLAAAQTTTLLPGPLAAVLVAALAAAAAWGHRLRRATTPGWPWPVWLLLLTSPVAIATSMLAAARGELLWPLFLAWAVPIAGGVSKLLCHRTDERPRRAPQLAAALALAVAAFAVPGPFAAPPRPLQHRDVLALLTTHPPARGARLLCAWPTYPELLDRRDVLAFPGAHLPAALDPGVGMPGDLVVVTPDLALQHPELPAIEQQLVRSGHWRRVGAVGAATLYERAPR